MVGLGLEAVGAETADAALLTFLLPTKACMTVGGGGGGGGRRWGTISWKRRSDACVALALDETHWY